MNPNSQINLLLELIACSQPLYYWCYDANGSLLKNEGSPAPMLDTVFRKTGCLDYALSAEKTDTILLSNEFHMVWIATREFDGEVLSFLHILGPFFTSSISEKYIRQITHQINASSASKPWRQALREAVTALPTLPSALYCQYAVMLHYCVTGERISGTDLQYQTNLHISEETFPALRKRHTPDDRLHVYRAERELLANVRQGNLDYRDSQKNAGNAASLRVYVDNPLKDTQIACTIFTSLCVRAAIEGGLSPTLAYSLGDAYIKSIFQASSVSATAGIKNQMYDDFIHRVHDATKAQTYSEPIQSTCDYIMLHLEDAFTLDLLAERLGYSKYYLSHRFKEEIGQSINHYIKSARVNRAMTFLATRDLSIDEIASILHFGSRSFFDNSFKKQVGMTPAEYRRQNRTN